MERNHAKKVKQQMNIRQITIMAMFIALTFIGTSFLTIRLPISVNGGLIHLGNVPVFVAAVLFGKKTGAIAGAFGMALFDVLSGWLVWAPFTFVIVGCIGFVFGGIGEGKLTIKKLLLAVLAAMGIKVILYYVAEVILYHNLFTPLTSILGNVIQIVIAGLIAIPVIFSLKKWRRA